MVSYWESWMVSKWLELDLGYSTALKLRATNSVSWMAEKLLVPC